jgi:cell wall-associated NlpC family hydrolase
VAKRLASTTQIRRGAVLTVALAVVSGVAIYAGAGAGAASAPTISQVQSQVNSLQARVDKLGEQYDAAGQQLTAANARLEQVSKETGGAQKRYNTASAGLTAIAVAEYENSNATSVLGLLSSGNPSSVLAQASLVMQVAGTHNEEAAQFLTSAQELAAVRLQQQHTEMGVAQIKAQLATEKTSLSKLLGSKQATLDSLTAAQQEQVAASSVGATDSTTTEPGATPVTYTGPTTTQADKAVAFAYAQLGKPYVWGATGPDSFDCSGLVQAAWAAAGLTIGRTTYDQWADLQHIPVADMQPGDLIIYNSEGHVAMYVGDGYIIDAPSTGLDVERIPYDTSWYVDNEDGVLAP